MTLRGKAQRDPLCLWPRFARCARWAVGVWLTISVADAHAQTLTEAVFGDPTTRYGHAVLGDAVEWGALKMVFDGPDSAPSVVEVALPQDHVFEDLAPRPVDLDLDGTPDAVMVIETDMATGAALALYGADGKITETPHIGRSNRWLAPIAAADLDGDGHVEIAYIDRPHLAKTLRIWRYRNGALHPVADKPGLTNHRIGEDFITSGLRECGAGPELITADARWRKVMATRLKYGQIESRSIGLFDGRQSVADALECKPLN
ncbi:MAG: VCBS repeat-containing protein [Rhodobacteraceae bacterium]|nr:VCBS repeat-containing protein [Paracoccaceae bacterium]